MSNNIYHQERFLLMTLDPVHVGTGGNRLGRVDNSIIREPGTRLPKIPGTALHGAIRQYAAYSYGSRRCAGAGQGDENKGKKAHCRDKKCPICYTFGYLKGQDGGQSGRVNIGDARLLLFPVHSLAGPVWVTSPNVLAEFNNTVTVENDKVKLSCGLSEHNHLNLGWLMLQKEEEEFSLPDNIPDGIPADIKSRIVLVSDKLFSQVVNSNLEVRTSVSIDPNTGAAFEGALFTYEAIPRAALLWVDVVEDDFTKAFESTDKKCKVEKDTENEKKENKYNHQAGEALGKKWERPLDVVTAGLKLAEYLGIGGMGTRGFGRVRLLNGEKSS